MQRNALLEVIADQRSYQLPKKLIERESLRPSFFKQSSQFIQVFSGIRRSGKSTLLHCIRNQKNESDYYLNFDDERLIDFTVHDFQKVYEIFLEEFGEQNTFYFDEIQNVAHWERFVRRLHDNGSQVYITGSNANLLSRELGTHLTGRYISTEVYPFSFREYLRFKDHKLCPSGMISTKEKVQLKSYYSQYLAEGGFPEYLITKNSDYLKHLYENILYKDILVRYKLPYERVLRELANYCASNIGKLISFNGLKKLFGVGSSTSIKEYLDYFEESYLFFSINKFDYSLKKQIYAAKKIYCIDTRLATEVGFRFSQEKGRYLENAVFMELKRRGKKIFYHHAQKECDFVLQEKTKIVEAIQVTSSMEEASTRVRELAGLKEAMETYDLKTGLILTENEEGEELVFVRGKKRKIVILPVWKWSLLVSSGHEKVSKVSWSADFPGKIE